MAVELRRGAILAEQISDLADLAEAPPLHHVVELCGSRSSAHGARLIHTKVVVVVRKIAMKLNLTGVIT